MKVRVPSPPMGESELNRITHKLFQSYTKAVGEAAVAWNNLQEDWAFLFHMIVRKEAKDDNGMSLTLWHSIDNDRLQRKLLWNAATRIKDFHYINADALDDIKWLKAESDKLSDSRNDAIHSPAYSMTSKDMQQTYVGPYPPWHPRAHKLQSRKDVLVEIRWCRDVAVTLGEYTLKLASAVASAIRPQNLAEPTLMTLPNRPKLPNRGQKSCPRPRSKAARPK